MTVDICGDPACTDGLCDVVVKAPTPINYSLTETWQYERIVNALGDPFGETDDIEEARTRFADFYEKATQAYDATRGLDEGGQIFVGRGEVEDSLRPAISAALKLGYSMTDMPEMFEVPRSRIVFEVGRVNGGTRDWTDDDWREFERVMRAEPTPTMREAQDASGLSPTLLRTLFGMYGKTPRPARCRPASNVQHTMAQ